MSVSDLMIAMAMFQIKHYLADFHWQTPWMVETKGRYGHPGGLIHAGLHGLLSVPVLFIMIPSAPAWLAGLVIFETALHYHIDWAKAWLVARRGIDESDSAYWHLLGLDQAAHQMTYLAMLAALALIGTAHMVG